jgi:uncharacterized membrane protein YagU involved in acid resistance
MVIRQLALAALVVGTLDIGEVTLFYWLRGVAPIRVVQGVATGLLGRASFQGGIRTALLGLALHFFIATVVVCVYHITSRKIALLRRSPIAMGVLYGLLVYAFMNAVVLPLSAAGPPKFMLPMVLNGLFAHVFCVGIPTALLARARQEQGAEC